MGHVEDKTNHCEANISQFCQTIRWFPFPFDHRVVHHDLEVLRSASNNSFHHDFLALELFPNPCILDLKHGCSLFPTQMPENLLILSAQYEDKLTIVLKNELFGIFKSFGKIRKEIMFNYLRKKSQIFNFQKMQRKFKKSSAKMQGG